MKNAYTLFAECPVLGVDPGKLPEFTKLLKDTAKKSGRVIMSERQMLTCPNFRRLLDNEAEDGVWLRQQITTGKIRAAMFDVYGDEKSHMTFAIFQQWFNQCTLWDLKPPQEKKIKQWLDSQSWGYQMPLHYRELSPATRKELQFLDTYTSKILIQSEFRDRDYVAAFLGGLNNPVLKQHLGKYHEAFRTIAQDVYADEQWHSTGTILVMPNAHVWNYDKNMNVSWRVLKALGDENVPSALLMKSLALIQAFSDATMAKITTQLIANALEPLEVTPVFSPYQRLQQDIMDEANTRKTSLDARQTIAQAPMPKP